MQPLHSDKLVRQRDNLSIQTRNLPLQTDKLAFQTPNRTEQRPRLAFQLLTRTMQSPNLSLLPANLPPQLAKLARREASPTFPILKLPLPPRRRVVQLHHLTMAAPQPGVAVLQPAAPAPQTGAADFQTSRALTPDA